MDILTLNFAYVRGDTKARFNFLREQIARGFPQPITVACLQEMPGGWGNQLLYGLGDGIARLARELGYYYYSAVAWSVAPYLADYRLGLVWHPKLQNHKSTFTVADTTRRVIAVGVRLADYQLVSLHLNPRLNIPSQLRLILPLINQTSLPSILAGDFNAPDPASLHLLEQEGFTTLPTGSTHANGRLDYIFVRSLELSAAEVLPWQLSDHSPVYGVVQGGKIS